MITTPKQKWVIDRLKRQGWRTDSHFMSYSPDQCLLWLPPGLLETPQKTYDTSFDWVGVPMFYMDNRKGLWMYFRPRQTPALHLNYHFEWLTLKNWDKLTKPFLETCSTFNKNRDFLNFDTFLERSSVYGTDVAVTGLHLVS